MKGDRTGETPTKTKPTDEEPLKWSWNQLSLCMHIKYSIVIVIILTRKNDDDVFYRVEHDGKTYGVGKTQQDAIESCASLFLPPLTREFANSIDTVFNELALEQ